MYGVLTHNSLRESLVGVQIWFIEKKHEKCARVQVSIQNLVAISKYDSHEVLGRELIRLLDHDLRFEAMHTVTKMKVRGFPDYIFLIC